MKTIGLIGGMSWESSAEYYRMINEAVKRRRGGLHSARCLMLSVDFAAVEEMQRTDRWDEAAELLADAAQKLERGGAELLLLCTNTMHRVAEEVAAATSVPFLHIADATADRLLARGIRSVGLLGTRYTMEQDFYRGRLADLYDLRVVVPDEPDRTIIGLLISDDDATVPLFDTTAVHAERAVELALA